MNGCVITILAKLQRLKEKNSDPLLDEIIVDMTYLLTQSTEASDSDFLIPSDADITPGFGYSGPEDDLPYELKELQSMIAPPSPNTQHVKFPPLQK